MELLNMQKIALALHQQTVIGISNRERERERESWVAEMLYSGAWLSCRKQANFSAVSLLTYYVFTVYSRI